MTGKIGPLVSILTPSFNQAAWLPDNLRSVACQSYPAIEHVVMDGGSPDGSVDILRAAGDAVVWRSEPDHGQAHAVNKAFAASSGEIIGWLNSDDAYFDCRVLEDVVAYFDAHPEVDVVYGHCVQITEDGHIIQVLWAPPFDAEMQRAVNLFMQPATFIRRSALAHPMLDESFDFAMDYELWLRLASQGRNFSRIDRITAIDRHQPTRKSSTIKDVNASDLKRLDAMYVLGLGSEHDAERSRFYVSQRLRAARLVPGIRRPAMAWSAPADFKRGVWKRQLVQRRRDWPVEYR
jgi:hypothetical protein